MPGVWNTGVTCLTVTLFVVIFISVANGAPSVSKRICPSRKIGCGGACGENMVCVRNCLRTCAITKRSDDNTKFALPSTQKETWIPQQFVETSPDNQCVLDAILENLPPQWKLDILYMYQLAIESTLNDDAPPVSQKDNLPKW
ncbi:uncharacterized protein [Amphiura filiformis]|uniref:uncharacterized protein n=1 Tax=Amphiura filiformis TaxID=82378 RepID=UPI003B21ED45